MKLQREKGIRAFEGEARRQRITLGDLGLQHDRWIIWLTALNFVVVIPSMAALAHWLAIWLFPHFPVKAFVFIYMVSVVPICTLVRVLFIAPRIRKALEAHERSSG